MGRSGPSEATPIVSATAIGYGGGVASNEADALLVSNDEEAEPQAQLRMQESDEIVPLANVLVDEDGAGGAPPVWRDVPFAVLFWIHFAIMLWLGIGVAPKGYKVVDVSLSQIEDEMRKSDDITEEDIHHFETFLEKAAAYVEIYPARILVYLVVPCCLLAFMFGLIVTGAVLKPCPRTIIYTCLVSSVIWTTIILLGSAIASGGVFLYVMTGVGLLAVAYYVRMAWRMVPFAAINLKIALEGIGRNCGIFIVAFFFAEVGFFWVVYWFYVLIGTFAFQNDQCQKEHPDLNFDMSSDDYDDTCDPPPLIVIFFLLSLYWTSTIIMNTMQVSVAGVMATFCLDKSEADNCCSSAIFGSLFRACTYSFGSICLGSLLQAIVAVLRYLIDTARARREQDSDNGNACASLLFCILDCIADLLEELLRAFNQWAYIFVGLYGYGYVESGKRVMELFQARGFTVIVTDNLVHYVLAFTSFMVSLATSFTAWLLEYVMSPQGEESESFLFGPLPRPGIWAAVVGFMIGVWVSSVMMNVLKGAVNTLIVCWADSPAAMEAQHPALSRELASTWRSVFSFLESGSPSIV